MTPQRREYLRNYQREWIVRRRADYFKDKVCAIPECTTGARLELDHIDPALKVTSSVWSWKKERRDVELAKCQPLCAVHHLEKTVRQRREGALMTLHGDINCYETGGCRCDLCKAAKSTRNAKRVRTPTRH